MNFIEYCIQNIFLIWNVFIFLFLDMFALQGVVLSFINIREQCLKEEVEEYLKEGLGRDAEIFQ